MKKVFIGFFFGSVTFLANAANWYEIDDLPTHKIDIDTSSISKYKGEVIGGGNSSNYVSAFVRFSTKPGSGDYEEGYGSLTSQNLVDCNSNMIVNLSLMYRDLNDKFVHNTRVIKMPKQSDFATAYPGTINHKVSNLLCRLNAEYALP